MSQTEITLECGHPGCTESFATGRSLWKYAEIEGREAGWDTSVTPERCPEHKNDNRPHEGTLRDTTGDQWPPTR